MIGLPGQAAKRSC